MAGTRIARGRVEFGEVRVSITTGGSNKADSGARNTSLLQQVLVKARIPAVGESAAPKGDDLLASAVHLLRSFHSW